MTRVCAYCNVTLDSRVRGGICPSCQSALDRTQFEAHGAEAMKAQESIVNNHNKHSTIRALVPYAASVAFAAIGAQLIIFAPESRETAANLAAAALLVVAMGIAGFTHFKAKAPGLEVSGERRLRSN